MWIPSALPPAATAAAGVARHPPRYSCSSKRSASTTPDQVIARIRRRRPACRARRSTSSPSRTFGSAAGRATPNINTRCRRQDLDLLALWGPRVLDKLSTLPELVDVSSDQQNSGLSSNVIIDRDTASRLGLTAQAVDSALYDAFGQRQVSTMYKSINQYHVVLALEQQWWESPDFLQKIYVQTPRGLSVPLSAFAHFRRESRRCSCRIRGNFRPPRFRSICRMEFRSAMPCLPSTRPSCRWDCPPASPAVSPAPRRRFRIR